MEFSYKGKSYSVTKTNCITSEGTPIYRYFVFNKRGQVVNAGEIASNDLQEIKEYLISANAY